MQYKCCFKIVHVNITLTFHGKHNTRALGKLVTQRKQLSRILTIKY